MAWHMRNASGLHDQNLLYGTVNSFQAAMQSPILGTPVLMNRGIAASVPEAWRRRRLESETCDRVLAQGNGHACVFPLRTSVLLFPRPGEAAKRPRRRRLGLQWSVGASVIFVFP